MSLLFNNSGYLKKTMASTAGFPATVIFIGEPQAAATDVFWGTRQSASSNQWQQVYWNTSTTSWHMGARGAEAANRDVGLGVTLALNEKYLVVARFRAANNRRLSVLRLNTGAIHHIQHTLDATTASLVEMSFGAFPDGASPVSGLGAGLTYLDADIVGADIATPDALMRQIAYRGPFSVPGPLASIVEYRSFRARTAQNDPAEIYYRRDKGVPAWVNNGGVLGGYPQPPQMANWVEPWNQSRIVPVYVPDTPVSDTGDATVDIAGDATVGQTLTAVFNDDDPDGAASSITYQWEADGAPIGGATNSTYLLTASEEGAEITVVVDYEDGLGNAESIESDPVGPVVSAPIGSGAALAWGIPIKKSKSKREFVMDDAYDDVAAAIKSERH